jgi:hypothetical protein
MNLFGKGFQALSCCSFAKSKSKIEFIESLPIICPPSYDVQQQWGTLVTIGNSRQ